MPGRAGPGASGVAPESPLPSPPTPTRATLVATLTSPPSEEALATLSGTADWLEVRADLVGDLDPSALRERFGGRLLYTLRSRDEGGRADAGAARRGERLAAAAAAGYDLIDLEGERDGDPELLAEVPVERRLVSWHGEVGGGGGGAGQSALAELKARFDVLAEIPARLYKLVPAAVQPGEELAPLALLRTLGRDDVIAFAGGPSGAWTRLLAPRLGAPWVYGSAGDAPGAAAAPGQPSIAALRRDYGLPELRPVERIYGVVGNPAAHSLSPRLHNGGYRELGVPALYLAFAPESFGDFWLEVVESGLFEDLGMPLGGLSITAPFKRAALAVAGVSSPLAEAIGAANTLVRQGAVWEAEITDPVGIVRPLAERGVDLAGCAAAVVGAGGAGRASAFALARAGARVTLVNRGEERGREAAAALGVGFVPLARFDPGGFAVVVQATPVGRGAGEAPPFDPARLAAGAVVIDLAYGPAPTPLIAAVRAAGGGAIGVDGREVLLYQGLEQFRMMTGRELPAAVGRRLLGLEAE